MSLLSILPPRLRRTSISFALMFVAYLAYSTLAVRWVEPTVTYATSPSVGATPQPRTSPYRKLFAEGSWELENTKRLEMAQGTLLFDECLPLENGNLSLTRCTLVSRLPGDDGEPRYAILRAPKGAELIFDTPFEFTKGQFGRLTSGLLRGRITIDIPPTTQSGNHHFHLETTNVQISETRIWAPGTLRFRYGQSHGEGRNLSLYFEAPEKTQGDPTKPTIGRLERLELDQVIRFDVHLAAATAPSILGNSPPAAEPASALLEVRCEGPLEFNFVSSKLLLSEKVDVLYHRDKGASDQLLCEQLEIQLTSSTATETEAAEVELKPHRLIATGYPAVIRVPDQQIEAFAETMEFTIDKRHLWLKDRHAVRLRRADIEIEAPELEYRFGESTRLGELWAAGPGRLQGRLQAVSGKAGQSTAARSVEVEWTEEVRLTPQVDNHVLVIKEARRVAFEQVGELTARELHLFLRETPRTETADSELQSGLKLDRFQALGNVRFSSPQLRAELEEARIWFREGVASAARSNAAPSTVWPQSVRAENENESNSVRRYHLIAQQLHGQVVLGEQPQLERLEIRNNITLREESAAGILIRGDAFDLTDGTGPQAVARLIGSPAQASSKNLELIGLEIVIRMADNVVEVQGAGSMTLTPPSQESGQAPVKIDWMEQMVFNGRTGSFRQNVTAQGSHRTENNEHLHFAARGEQLDVTLSRHIDLQQPPRGSKSVDLREMQFRGWVYLDHRLVTPGGQLKSLDQMQVRDLTMDQYTGNLHGFGPGWLQHRGPSRFAGQTTNAPQTYEQGTLQFLRVDFAQQMVGNLHQRQVQFEDQIRCLFGVIPEWNSTLTFEGRHSLKEQDVLLTSQVLELVDMETPGGVGHGLELRATGQAEILGRSFRGSGSRLSYARGKDQLILEGTGRQDAVLEFQKVAGADPVNLSVAKVLFYPRTKQFSFSGIRSLEIPQLDRQFDRSPGARETR